MEKSPTGEFKIGDSIFMISDESPGCQYKSPEALGGSTVTLHLYVTDADAAFADAIKTGAPAAATWSMAKASLGIKNNLISKMLQLADDRLES